MYRTYHYKLVQRVVLLLQSFRYDFSYKVRKELFQITISQNAAPSAAGPSCAPLPELMDRKKRDIMERKGDKEDENKRQKQQKESSAAAL